MFQGVVGSHWVSSVWAVTGWLQFVERELLFFALFWFIIGMVDEMLVDAVWIALRLIAGRRTPTFIPPPPPPSAAPDDRDVVLPDEAPLAVFIAAWQEAAVIGATVGHMLAVWPDRGLRIYVGCYCNDPATVAAVIVAAGGDPRVRIVITDRPGPTTKADCLNRLYTALLDDEHRQGYPFLGVVLHDAEDMVHRHELTVVAQALREVDFVQLPVRPELPAGPHWVAGHYGDEFVESHARVMMVRDALGAALPAAGVGCGFKRTMLARIGELRHDHGEQGPFVAECFTEDYEIGLLVTHLGGRARFLRLRDEEGMLIATRSYFPDTLAGAVRQKTRWIHGIALQSWDRMGWMGRPVDLWMALRDRRGPLLSLVLTAAYGVLLLEGVLLPLRTLGWAPEESVPPLIDHLATISFLGLLWRMVMRFGFSAREYGWVEGLRAIVRIPVANFITIMAGRRALMAYVRTLRGMTVVWDKTPHLDHPLLAAGKAAA